MRLSHAIKAISLCLAWVLCLEAAPASAPSNRPVEAVRTKAEIAVPILALNRRGFVECGAVQAPPLAVVHRVTKREARRLRRGVNVCMLPKLGD